MSISWVGSPNYTKGREGQKVSGIVIHWMAGTLAATDQVFKDTTRNTSAHYGIEDTTVHQYVSEADTAYHAGTWAKNLTTIGIEHSAQPGRDASEATYQTSAKLIAEICSRYGLPINADTIVPHRSIVATQCPGTVDLAKLIRMAQAIATGEPMFNEGDRLNINNYLYGEDRGRFKSAVGKEWKEAMYFSIFETPEFKIDELVNTGDIPAIELVFGTTDGKTMVGRTWKDVLYHYGMNHKIGSADPKVQAFVTALKDLLQ